MCCLRATTRTFDNSGDIFLQDVGSFESVYFIIVIIHSCCLCGLCLKQFTRFDGWLIALKAYFATL